MKQISKAIGLSKIVFFITLVFFSVDCGGYTKLQAEKVRENKTMSEKTDFRTITLNAEAKKEGDKLIVEYTLHNDSEQKIYVFDIMPDYKGYEQFINDETAYCFFESPNILRLVRGILNLPLEKEVRVKEIPFAREIDVNGDAKGKIVFSLPVNERSPFYAFPDKENSKIEKSDKIHLIIGWTKFREGMTIQETTVGGVKALRVFGAYSPVQTLSEVEIAISTEVLTHTDTFDRQMPMK
jgi:hypothetical protein